MFEFIKLYFKLNFQRKRNKKSPLNNDMNIYLYISLEKQKVLNLGTNDGLFSQ